MDYSKEILEELKKINSNLLRLINKQNADTPHVSDFDDQVKAIKDRIKNRVHQVTNNK